MRELRTKSFQSLAVCDVFSSAGLLRKVAGVGVLAIEAGEEPNLMFGGSIRFCLGSILCKVLQARLEVEGAGVEPSIQGRTIAQR